MIMNHDASYHLVRAVHTVTRAVSPKCKSNSWLTRGYGLHLFVLASAAIVFPCYVLLQTQPGFSRRINSTVLT